MSDDSDTTTNGTTPQEAQTAEIVWEERYGDGEYAATFRGVTMNVYASKAAKYAGAWHWFVDGGALSGLAGSKEVAQLTAVAATRELIAQRAAAAEPDPAWIRRDDGVLRVSDDPTPTTITIPAGTRCTITLHGDGDGATPDGPKQPAADADDVVPLPPGEAVEIGDWDERWIHAAGKRDVYFQTRYSKYQEWRDSTQPHATIVRRAAAYLNQQRRADRAANKEQ